MFSSFLKKLNFTWKPLCEMCPNAGKYGPEKTPYLDTFHAVHSSEMIRKKVNNTTEIFKKLAVVFDKILSEYLKFSLLKITFCNIFLLRFTINSAVLCQA